MTVQELIDELSKVEDKTMEVCFPYSHGTQENGDPLNVNEVSVYDDCVVIYNYPSCKSSIDRLWKQVSW